MRSHLTRAWVEVDLGALRRNGAAMAGRGAALVPMVKADGYGLGAVQVARALEALAPWGFGVAAIAEGIELREAGIERPVFVFTPVRRQDLGEVCRAGLTPTLGGAAEIAQWASIGGGAWHLSIDTGMNRAGVRWDEVDALAEAIVAAPPEGAFTHFHSAELDDGSLRVQEERFEQALARLPVRPRFLHAENSAALARTHRSRWHLARPGVFLYGVGSGPGALVQPEPVAHVRAPIVDLRTVPAGESVSYDATFRADTPRRIATLAIGYADGYRRSLSGRGIALLHGRRVPVAGLVTMDMTMIDVTDVDCAVGDVATLVGRDGAELLDVESVAQAADLSPYELLTGLRGRLEHVYVGGA
jgi:alanine racemase